jgi:hypothetical protein
MGHGVFDNETMTFIDQTYQRAAWGRAAEWGYAPRGHS